MKLQYWLTIAAASSLAGSGVLAQGVHGVPPLPVPHTQANRPDNAGKFMPDLVDPALPNRRIPNRRLPSLVPPQPSDVHPVTPDKAWPKPPAIKPARPSTQRLGERDREGIQDLPLGSRLGVQGN